MINSWNLFKRNTTVKGSLQSTKSIYKIWHFGLPITNKVNTQSHVYLFFRGKIRLFITFPDLISCTVLSTTKENTMFSNYKKYLISTLQIFSQETTSPSISIQSNTIFISVLQTGYRAEVEIYTIASFWKAHFWVCPWLEREQ